MRSLALADLVRVGRPRVNPASATGVTFTGLGDVEPGTMRLTGGIPASGVKSVAVRYERGDVLYGRLRPYLNKLFLAKEAGLASAEFIPLTANPDITPQWLAYRLNAADFVRYATRLNTGDRPRVDWSQLRDFKVLLPSLREQHRIVAAIETHFSRLDAAVASLIRAKANVKRARASVLKAAVEGRLVPTEAALARAEGRDYEPATVLLERILTERRAASAASGAKGKYKEPVQPETGGVSELPDGWCLAALDQMGSWSSGGTPPRSRADFFGGDIPWVKTGELRDCDLTTTEERITTAGLEGSSAKVFPVGTLLIAMYGATIGMTARLAVPAATNQACAALLPDQQNAPVLPYLWAFLIGERAAFRREGQGGAQPNISQAILRSWHVPLPPLAEQHRIVAEVDRRLSVLDALDTTLDTNLARCARLRQAILKRAFEGRLVRCEGDVPDGERHHHHHHHHHLRDPARSGDEEGQLASEDVS